MKNLFLLLLVLLSLSCEKDNNNSSEKVDKNILIIGIDGFRADAMQQSISPFMFSLSESSQTYFSPSTKTEVVTSSGPNWTSLLTGVHQDKHNVVSNSISDFGQIAFNEYPHFMKYVEDAKPSYKTVSLVNWYPINIYVTRDFADQAPIDVITDSVVFEKAKSFLDPAETDILFLHFDNLDHVGHAIGYHPDTSAYREAVETMDTYVEGLVEIIENKRAQGEDWMIFIVSDHGGHLTDHTSYPDNPDVYNTIFFANHPTIKFTDNLNTEQVNLVPTILDYLEIKSEEFDDYTDGVSLLEK